MTKHLLIQEPRVAIWDVVRGLSNVFEIRTFESEDMSDRSELKTHIDLAGYHPHIWFSHEIKGGKRVKYRVALTTTKPYYGNRRYWFRCPLMTDSSFPCGRRVAKLYKVGAYYGCRHCHDLTYPSKQIANKAKRSQQVQNMVNTLRIERMSDRVKRAVYGGNPTQQYQKLLRLTGEIC